MCPALCNDQHANQLHKWNWTGTDVLHPWVCTGTHGRDTVYTASQKTSPSLFSYSLVKQCRILIIFGRNIPEKIWVKGVVPFPTHLTGVFALPGEIM